MLISAAQASIPSAETCVGSFKTGEMMNNNQADKDLKVGAGRTLFKQNEKGGDLYFIKAGHVILTVRDEKTGAEATVAELGPKSVIGTMSFLEGDPRSATATAKTEVTYVMINQAQRDTLLGTVPAWFRVLVKDLSASMRRLNESFIKLKADYTLLEKKAEVKNRQVEKMEKDAEAEKASNKKIAEEAKIRESTLVKEIQTLKAALATAQTKK